MCMVDSLVGLRMGKVNPTVKTNFILQVCVESRGESKEAKKMKQ